MISDFARQKFTRYFELWDTNNSGDLTVEDLSTYVERLANLKGIPVDSPPLVAMQENTNTWWNTEILPKVDVNNDGSISLDEWLNYCEAQRDADKVVRDAGGRNVEREQFIGMLFHMIDRDGGGTIGPEEWATFYSAFGISADAAEVFKSLDTNNDGSISLEEVTNHFYTFVFSEDPNEPGNYMFGSLS